MFGAFKGAGFNQIFVRLSRVLRPLSWCFFGFSGCLRAWLLMKSEVALFGARILGFRLSQLAQGRQGLTTTVQGFGY